MSTEAAAATPAAPAQPAPAVTAPTPAAPAATPAVVQLVMAPAAPAAAPAPAAPVAPVVPVADPEAEPAKDPGWLKGRTERAAAAERKKMLESLGVTSEDEIKAALDARKAQEEAKKSIEQKAIEATAALDVERKRASNYEVALRSVVDAELAKAPEALRATVLKHAGSDPTKQIEMLRDLLPVVAPPPAQAAPSAAPPAGVTPAAPAAPAGAPADLPMVVQLPDGTYARVVTMAAPPAAAAPPATGTQAIPPTQISTAPAPGGPPPVAAAPANAWEQYQALRKDAGPAAAAEFLHKNAAAMERDMPKR